MISPGGLDVGVVLIEAEVNESALRFVIPFALAVPEFSGAGLEGNAVERDAKPCAVVAGRLFGDFRIRRNVEVITLRGDRVWIAAARKFSRVVVGQAIGGDDSLSTGDFDGDAICANARVDAVGCTLIRRLRKRGRDFDNGGSG